MKIGINRLCVCIFVYYQSENVPDGKRIRFIPYQDFMTEVLWEEIGKNECNSGKLLAENNSNYFGAGGLCRC
ncbi:hypothetical protein [Ehrlichia chaffeensis]|uniref:hypothetical protein n=1 Tax=Ehrlichia chaffeensis TaxID=945 RepID=UPI0002F95B44|nr:hypothetical protein [Ehrlichia chaffeensis]AHX05225.1 hypothetical protein ECHJAX_0133 [Ehrlichia chaffeensis str. Jax]AHX08008.1 hypothetical protein ECHOSC_0139 [Ehrlichia chaffeensis str. Osceola]